MINFCIFGHNGITFADKEKVSDQEETNLTAYIGTGCSQKSYLEKFYSLKLGSVFVAPERRGTTTGAPRTFSRA